MLRPRQYVHKSPKKIGNYSRTYGKGSPSWKGTFQNFILGSALLILDLGLVGWFTVRLWAVLCVDPDFDVREIHVEGAKSFTPGEIVVRSKLQQGENIFKVDIQEARRILEEEPLFRKVSVWRQLPREIFIQVSEREPIAQIILGHEKDDKDVAAWLVDSEGVVVSNEVECSKLYPILAVTLERSVLRRGSRIFDEGFSRALNVLEIFSGSILKKMMELEVIELKDKSDVVLRGAHELTVHLGKEDFEDRLIRFLTIMEDLKKKGQTPLSIDLRFKYVPVVLKEEKKVRTEV